MVPSDLGSQIAQISHVKGESPYLEINKNYITKNKKIKNIAKQELKMLSINFCYGGEEIYEIENLKN